jgi:tetratricopeptide (TPR) repeat protein
MKKILITVFTAFMIANLNAQTIQDGINHLYADRFKNAEQTFQKILAANPNVAEATYWLGQTYLDMDNNDAARQLYDKALAANGNNPIIMVGKGHVLLLDKKKDEARQLFESAITLSTAKGKEDPNVLNAIGRANVDAKEGNLDFALDVLQRAAQRDPKNADIALNLGNALRKKNVGVGGEAYTSYLKAAEINPKFAYPYVRIAKIYETQKQWDLVLENLNKAAQIDPNFSLAYYELFYYYFFAKQDYATAEQMLQKYVNSRVGEDPWETDYLSAQLCWARKDYNCAVTKAESVKATMGANVKPRVLKLLAYSYLGKNDFATAKNYVDQFFAKEKDPFVGADYQLKADIYTASGASCEDVYATYMQGATADTVLQSKIDFMNKAADFFRTKKCSQQEADMRLAIYNTRKNPSPAGLFNIALAYQQAGNLPRADSLYTVYNTAFPDSIFGYLRRGRIAFSLDSTMTQEPYVTNLLQNYQKTLDIATTDKIRYRTMGTEAALVLIGYYANVKKSRDTAYSYVLRGLDIDSTNTQLKGIRDIFDKQKNQKSGGGKTTGRPSAAIRKPSSNS